MADITASSDDVTRAYERARQFVAGGRFGEASRVYQGLLEMGLEDAELHYRFGTLFAEWGAADVKGGEVYAPIEFTFPWGKFPFPTRDHYPVRKLPDALTHLRKALELNPAHAGAMARLALLLVQDTGTLREGADLAQRAMSEAPDDHQGHLAMSVLGLRQGNWMLARAASLEAERQQPDCGEAGALRIFAEAVLDPVKVAPDFTAFAADPLIFLADQLAQALDAGGLSEAQRAEAVQATEALIDRLLNLAEQALLETQAMVHAARCLDHARRLDPGGAFTGRVAGLLLFKSGIFGLAERALDHVLKIDPGDARAEQYIALARFADTPGAELQDGAAGELEAADLMDLAETLAAQLEFEKAESLSARAAEQKPKYLAATLMRAQLNGLLGDVEKAAEILEQARQQRPDSAEIAGNLANVYLAQARPAEAWPLYESRLMRKRGSTPREVPSVPQWSGDPAEAGHILIWREEGIGDEVRFSSCLPDAIQHYAGPITYDCDPRLQSLYARSFPTIAVRGEDLTRDDADAFDLHMPAGSLPGLFRRSLDDFPEDGTFLKADPALTEAWRQRLAGIGPGPKIGVGWRSLNAGWHKLSLHARLADLHPVASLPGVHLVNLQCGLRDGEIEAAASALGVPVHHFAELDLDNDMENVAALIDALDAVVSCQCWLLHLGGALGAKVYTFNMRPNPYLMGLETNPWAPSVEAVYRQPGEDWQGAINKIANRLRQRFDLGDG